MQITRVGDITCKLGEGPVWDPREQALYFVDVMGRQIVRYRLSEDAFDHFDMPGVVGSLGLREGGGAIVAMTGGVALFDFESGAVTPLGDPEAELPLTQWNDGKVDPRGRFLTGTVATDMKSMICGLYSVDRGVITQLDNGFGITNGPCWSPDGEIFYFADSIPQNIYAYDYDLDTGAVSNRRVFANTAELGGIPDGATVDTQGRLWSAICSAGKIACWRPDGTLERVIDVPPKLVSSVMFGGPDLDRLFVTSIDGASLGFPSDETGGQLFVIDGLDARGVPEPRYQG